MEFPPIIKIMTVVSCALLVLRYFISLFYSMPLRFVSA